MRTFILTVILAAPLPALACGMPSNLVRFDKALADVDAALAEPAKPEPAKAEPVQKAPAQAVRPADAGEVTPSVIAEVTPQS